MFSCLYDRLANKFVEYCIYSKNARFPAVSSKYSYKQLRHVMQIVLKGHTIIIVNIQNNEVFITFSLCLYFTLTTYYYLRFKL